MTNHQDEQFDALLRDLGPDVPRPELENKARAHLLSIVSASPSAPLPTRIGRAPWLIAATVALIATLGLWSIVSARRLSHVSHQLAAARWETSEAIELLMKARRTQPIVPVPDDLNGLTRDDLVLITFHHDLCPIARVCTPGFRALAQAHADEPERFLALDVTGPNRSEAQDEIDALELQYALIAPLGAETGVVKVLDTTHRRVLCAAPGQRGLEQAQRLLALVPPGDGRP